MTPSPEIEIRQMCRIAPPALSLMHIFSTILELYTETGRFTVNVDALLLVWFAVFLSPVATIFLFRRNCIALGALAVPVFAIFFGDIYYYNVFANSRHLVPNGNWATWLSALFGMISVIIAFAWILLRAGNGVSRTIGKFLKETVWHR